MSVTNILRQKYPSHYFSGLIKGQLDDSQTKLFAYSILSVNQPEFEYLLPVVARVGYGYEQTDTDPKKYTIDNFDGTYSYKDLEQLIQEGVFKFVGIRFSGILHESEWYLREHYTFFQLH